MRCYYQYQGRGVIDAPWHCISLPVRQCTAADMEFVDETYGQSFTDRLVERDRNPQYWQVAQVPEDKLGKLRRLSWWGSVILRLGRQPEAHTTVLHGGRIYIYMNRSVPL